MATLTAEEQVGFTAEQLTEVAKIANSKLVPSSQYLEGRTEAYFRADIIARWRLFSANQLRAIACFGFSSAASSGTTITWSGESDLTSDEKTYVEDMIGAVDKSAMELIVEAIGGAKSPNQRLTALGG